MDFKKYWQQIKEDNKRMWSATKLFDRTYFFQIAVIFIINLVGIFLITTMKEKFPVQVFLVIFAVSACVIVNILLQIFKENVRKNMPQIFAEESKKYGIIMQEFKCPLIFLGNVHFRGFYCRIYVYKNALLAKFGKHCLVIDDYKYIRLDKALIGCRCEFEKDDTYVQCRLNNKQLEIIKEWQKDITEQNKYWNDQ